jgi:hypothetical protein
MENLESLYKELTNEIIKNFSFFVPYNVIGEKITHEILNFYNIEFTQEFVDIYVDQLLYFDENLEIKVLESFEFLKNYNTVKLQKLEDNCFQLVRLKDTLGKASFKYIYNKYIDNVVLFNKLCSILIDSFYKFYPNNEGNPTFLFEQQRLIFETHLKDIELKIGVKGGGINENEIITNLINSPFVKPYIQETQKTSEQINKKEPTIKPFRDFILHKNNDEIEKITKQHFSDLKGVKLRYLIEYFIEKKVLILNTGDKTKLHKSFEVLFEGKNIGKYNSIYDIKYFTLNDPNYIKSKNVFENLFKDFLN